MLGSPSMPAYASRDTGPDFRSSTAAPTAGATDKDLTTQEFNALALDAAVHPYHCQGQVVTLKWPTKSYHLSTGSSPWLDRLGRKLSEDAPCRALKQPGSGQRHTLHFADYCRQVDNQDIQKIAPLQLATRHCFIALVDLEESSAYISWNVEDKDLVQVGDTSLSVKSKPIECVVRLSLLFTLELKANSPWSDLVKTGLQAHEVPLTGRFSRAVQTPQPLSRALETSAEQKTYFHLFNFFFGQNCRGWEGSQNKDLEEFLPALREGQEWQRRRHCKFILEVVFPTILWPIQASRKGWTRAASAPRVPTFKYEWERQIWGRVRSILDGLSAVQGHWVAIFIPAHEDPFLHFSASERDTTRARAWMKYLKYLCAWFAAHASGKDPNEIYGADKIELLVKQESAKLAAELQRDNWRKLWKDSNKVEEAGHFVVNPRNRMVLWAPPDNGQQQSGPKMQVFLSLHQSLPVFPPCLDPPLSASLPHLLSLPPLISSGLC